MISVAVAAYNGERFIEKQLNSIREQNLSVGEVVICDDCSTDKTFEICQKFIEKNALKNWRLYKNETNVGYCLNFYGAIEKCCGDIIFLADQDDEWYPEKTEKMMACMNENPHISVLSSRYDVIDAESNKIENSGVSYLGKMYDDSIEYISPESQIGCSYIRGLSICFRKELKPLIKPIDLKSLLSHDWLICMVGAIVGKTAVLNTILTSYRYHGDNVTLMSSDKKKSERKLGKRIRGVEESIDGHSYLTTLSRDEILNKQIEKFIKFEEKRLKFLESKNLFTYLSLFFKMGEYNRYYKGNGIRVWLGDFVYAYKND